MLGHTRTSLVGIFLDSTVKIIDFFFGLLACHTVIDVPLKSLLNSKKNLILSHQHPLK